MSARPGPAKVRGGQVTVFGAAFVRELEAEALRLDRPMSWVMQRAWRIARKGLAKIQPRAR